MCEFVKLDVPDDYREFVSKSYQNIRWFKSNCCVRIVDRGQPNLLKKPLGEFTEEVIQNIINGKMYDWKSENLGSVWFKVDIDPEKFGVKSIRGLLCSKENFELFGCGWDYPKPLKIDINVEN